MKVKYIVISIEELPVLGEWGCLFFNGRTPREAVKKHDNFFGRKKELFGNCDCFIGTIYKKEVKKI